MNCKHLFLLFLLITTYTGLSQETTDILINELVIDVDNTGKDFIFLELKGTPNEAFSGSIFILESVQPGTVNNKRVISSNFNAEGLFVIDSMQMNSPRSTYVFASTTEIENLNDFDLDNDGEIDDISQFGIVHDAIGNGVIQLNNLYGEQLGGADFQNLSAGKDIIFRDGESQALFIASPPDEVVADVDGNNIDPIAFSENPFQPTLGAQNPFLCGFEPIVIEFADGSTELEACPGDQVLADIEINTISGLGFTFVIDNSTEIIISVGEGLAFDFETADPGSYNIVLANLSDFDQSLTGKTLQELEGCVVVSNPLSVTVLDPESQECTGGECLAEAGSLTFADGNTELTICPGDQDIDISITGGSDVLLIAVTELDGNIVAFLPVSAFPLNTDANDDDDDDEVEEFNAQLFAIHADDLDEEVLASIENISELEGCFALSNPIILNLLNPNGPECIDEEPQCPSEDVVIRSQADIEAFAAQFPNCPDLPVSIFITEYGATFGDITDLSPLSFIETVDGDFTFAKITRLTNLTGLENLQSVSGFFGFTRMVRLADLSALSNLSSVGSLQFSSIRSLTDLSGLESLSSVEDQVRILYNRNLTSLNGLTLSNGIGGRLQILSNPNLSFCSNQAVCNHLNANKPAQISNNAEGCSSIADVTEWCFSDSITVFDVRVSPNPVLNELTILDLELQSNNIDLNILDSYGQVVKSLSLPAKGNQISITVADLPKGIYYLQFVDGETSYQSSFMKM